MAKVDSKGRIVLPKEVRERLGITPGTEVAIREEDGKAVVEPEDDPKKILSRMERLVSESASRGEETRSLQAGDDPVARKHRAVVDKGAAENNDE